MTKTLLKLGSLLAAAPWVNAACECGYKTNTGEVWQYAVETDYSKLTALDWGSSPDWNIVEIAREATVTLNYTQANVALSGGNLQLTCSAYNTSSEYGIRSGEIRSNRSDIMYGSFRASYSVDARSPGSVAGFFFYANDTQEIDIEVQSKMDGRTVHLGNQPTQSTDVYLPNGGIVGGMHDYRFDWLRNGTKFYLDSVPAGGFTKDVPVVDGTINFNMWGNGGSFSGPQTPTTDNVMSISKIAMYFNSSSKSTSAQWEKACKAANKKSVCEVDAVGLAVNKTTTDNGKSSASKGTKSKGSSRLAKVGKVLPLGLGTALYHM
jgi:hypothetical protein